MYRREGVLMLRTILGIAVLAAVVGCAPAPSTPPTPPPVTLPADMPPLNCADFEPPPVPRSANDFIWRKCTSPGAPDRWIGAFYECADGRIWPVLTTVSRPPIPEPEPTGPAFDACVGRS